MKEKVARAFLAWDFQDEDSEDSRDENGSEVKEGMRTRLNNLLLAMGGF